MRKVLDSVWFAAAMLAFATIAMVVAFSQQEYGTGWVWFAIATIDTIILGRNIRIHDRRQR